MTLQVINLIGISGVFGALAWIGKRIFELGKMMHRLDRVEGDVKNLEADIKGLRKELSTGLVDLNKRIDSLMLAITKLCPGSLIPRLPP